MNITRRSLLRWTQALAGWSIVAPDSTTADSIPVARGDPINLFDFEPAARQRLPASVYAFIAGGAGDELTVRWNRESLDRIRLLPRNFEDVSGVDLSVHQPGLELPHPILLAPIGFQRMMHAEGETATVRGAGGAGATTVVSMGTTTATEILVRAATRPIWSQLYFLYSRAFVQAFVERVEAAGTRAIVLTIDTASNGPRNRQDRAEFAVPPTLDVPHLTPGVGEAADPKFVERVTWKDVEWLRSIVHVPLWLKGVLNPIEADRAIRVGVAGLVVSNHGGRNLDGNPATIDALPRVVEAVAARVPILMDGGIRRGTDVLKALALGANAVLIGRPYAYGLAVGGAAGVGKVVEILKTELRMAMMLTGRATVASIDRSVLWP
jgi:4-hydroxymandelate oxidase